LFVNWNLRFFLFFLENFLSLHAAVFHCPLSKRNRPHCFQSYRKVFGLQRRAARTRAPAVTKKEKTGGLSAVSAQCLLDAGAAMDQIPPDRKKNHLT
jgi:hypothetical protein